jgi:hypothetical protein
MSLYSQRHRNSVILTQQGFRKLRAAQAETDLWNPITQSCTLESLAELTGLSTHTLSKVHARKKKVDFSTIDRYFAAFDLTPEPGDYEPPIRQAKTDRALQNTAVSWELAPDVAGFCGRTAELETLRQWILTDRSRFITLFGMGGIGKTWLAAKLAEQVQPHFQSLVWRHLEPIAHPPLPFGDFLDDLIRDLSPHSLIPDSINGKIRQVMKCLEGKSHLLVLDNVESILEEYQSPATSETSDAEPQNPDWEAYRKFLQHLAQGRHQSCVVLTSRIEPNLIYFLGGNNSHIRSLSLPGLPVADIREMLGVQGTFQVAPEDWDRLADCYDGNPKILNIVAATVLRLFNRNFTEFFRQNTLIFDEIGELLEEQLNVLSDPARTAIALLAAEKAPLSLSELRSHVSSSIARKNLVGMLTSLKARSLVNLTETHVCLNPLLGNYLALSD